MAGVGKHRLRQIGVLLHATSMWMALGQPIAAQSGPAKPAAATASRTAPRPNFVVILADDLGFADVGFNGRTEFRTPNLDRIANEGTNFRRFYSGGVICGPSRASLLTGRYTIHHGVTGNGRALQPGETTLAQALKPLGYKSALFGKWDGGKTPLERGFDEFIGYGSDVEAWDHFPKTLKFGSETRPVSGYSADLVSDYGRDFIRRHKAEPFLLMLTFIEPHLKLEAPPEDVARLSKTIADADKQRPYNATYAAMIERFDAAVGRVLATLQEQGLDKNTIVLLTSDNGATFEVGNLGASASLDSNRPYRGGKRSILEGGARMPTAIRWPGQIPAGRVSNDMLSQIDILPTFLAAAGAQADPRWNVDGLNVLAAWQGKAPPAPRTLFLEYRQNGWFNLAAMSGDWKLVVESKSEFEALSDVPPLPAAEAARLEAMVGEAAQANQPVGPIIGPYKLPQVLGTLDAPKLYNLTIDPGERRSFYFSQTEVANRLRGDLLAWLKTEVTAPDAQPASNESRPTPPPLPAR